MKNLSREFSRREKLLILIMVLILVFAGYYKFVFQATKNTIEESNQKAAAYEAELITIQIQLDRMEQMRQELEKEKSNASMSYMFSYNNINAEIEFLHQILDDTTLDYRLSFSDVMRDGDQIRRPVSIQFTAADYDTAERIINSLENCRMRCLISQVQANAVEYNYYANRAESRDLQNSAVSASCSVIFYETMVGGQEDAGLPVEVN